VDSLENKLCAANAKNDTVTVVNGNTGCTISIPVGDFPAKIGINPETNLIYVSAVNGANTTILGDTDTAITTARATDAMNEPDYYRQDQATIQAAGLALAGLQEKLDQAYRRWNDLD